jgi:hypothetical protein
MAGNTSNGVNYYLCLPVSHKHLLGALRNWENVKIGYNGDEIWLKDLEVFQAESTEVRTIPRKAVYYARDGKLFLKGSLLPERNIPSLLWTRLERGLQLSLPGHNHNYFGLNHRIEIKLIPSVTEQDAFASMISLKMLQGYLNNAPAVRTSDLRWTIIGDEAFIAGVPLLPLPGKVFWRRDNQLLPAGYDLELYTLSAKISKMIDPECEHWIIWMETGEHYLIPERAFAKLTRASFRSTVKEIV